MIATFGGHPCYYDLDEELGWRVVRSDLEEAYFAAKDEGIDVKAIFAINPGNPTGAVMSEDEIFELLDFARDKQLIVLADEVYQENVYTRDRPFVSFKKVLRDQQEGIRKDMWKLVQLISFHSISKGLTGECGQRGGYAEFVGFDRDVKMTVFNKVCATNLSPGTLGQIFVGLQAAPPQEGDESFPLYEEERKTALTSLKRRKHLLEGGINAIDGLHSTPIEGAMYTFPTIEMPENAIEQARFTGMGAD